MTELADTAFGRFPEKKEEYEQFAEAVPRSERRKVCYFWVAETSSETIPQYTTQGKENSYAKVREAHSRGDLEEFYWVPIDSEASDVVGVAPVEASDFRALRRGRIDISRASYRTEAHDKVYAIRHDDTFLVVGPRGSVATTRDESFTPEVVC